MTALRRGQGPFNLEDLPKGTSASDVPPISALFLIYFDIKAGYTIGWKRSQPGLELEGVVEYKSLPSGLHTVKEDLIYFVHDGHAGLSAFINAPAAEESRNARMIAVGAMVPLSYGRLGRSWRHAGDLKAMASALVKDVSNTKILEEFWEQHKSNDEISERDTDSPMDSPSSIKYRPTAPKTSRNRSVSDGTALVPPGHNLSAYHPAWSLLNLLETLGPLIFPIHRAALLRKRILITGHAPVQETCNFVYALSVLSNIPIAVTDLLVDPAPPQRLRPLFSIGIHDIPILEEDLRASKERAASPNSEDSENTEETGCGWIACTTDSILAMKSTLYDVLISVPPTYSEDAQEKVWPKVESPQGIEMKASQRDLRRYKALRWGLSHYVSPPTSPALRRTSTGASDSDPPRLSSSTTLPRGDPMLDIPETDAIIEPLSWSALAYSGFMWWASAGEQRLHSEEETEADATLLSGLSLSPNMQSPYPNQTSGGDDGLTEDASANQEMAVIAYFHRLTTQILTTMSDVVDATDSDDEREHARLVNDNADAGDDDGEESGPAVYITTADVERMGLDIWSVADHQFIEDIATGYFATKAQVEGRNVDVCGIRIC